MKGKTPNAWGLYDMSGNVSEWTWDLYDFRYPEGAVTDPVGSSSDSSRVYWGAAGSAEPVVYALPVVHTALQVMASTT